MDGAVCPLVAAWLVGGTGGYDHLAMTFFLCLRKRYYYYLTNGIRKDMISPEDDDVMERINKLIPKVLLTTPALEPLQAELRSEKNNDYYFSLMKSIGKAGLMQPRSFSLEGTTVFLSSLCQLALLLLS